MKLFNRKKIDKMKNPKSFFNKLRKLIEEEMPEDCTLAYDMGSQGIFVIKKTAKFIERPRYDSGTSWHGVLTPVNEPYSDEGYEKKAIVGRGIYVELAAVQNI